MSTQKPRILAIDDTPANLAMLGATLAAEYDLQVATSGQMGLTLAGESTPDLILLDVMMPEMDGYETCRRLMADARLRQVPVIFVTALNDAGSETTGLALGAADYITKPINVDIARRRIRNLLDRERLRKEVEGHRDHLEELVRARTLDLSIAKEAAEAANRAKTSFLANMSHELRTPLNGIMGMNDLARRRATDPRQKDQLDKVALSAKRLLTVINDILDMSKIEAEQLALDTVDFELGDVLQQLEKLCAPDAEAKRLVLSIALDAGLASLPLSGDAQRLGQVLFHLTGNATKFTTMGSVSVAAHVAEETPVDFLLRFEVRDSGIGIAAEDQQRLFKPFEQADGSMTRAYGGTGLGLALSKRLVMAMGGEIGVESQAGAGSCFWFTARLGKAAGPAATRTALRDDAAEEQVKTRHAGARILLAEDEPFSREIASILMQDAGLRVDLATDGDEAVSMAADAEYDLILMDIQMPRLNGVDAARAIRALPGCADTPILALTASVSGEDKARCFAAGMSDFIAQPVRPDQLFDALLLWLDRR